MGRRNLEILGLRTKKKIFSYCAAHEGCAGARGGCAGARGWCAAARGGCVVGAWGARRYVWL